MDIKPQILVVLPLEERHHKTLQEAAPEADFCFRNENNLSEKDITGATVIIGQVPPKLCCLAKNLAWYQCHAAGPDAYLKEGIIRPEALITSATGVYGLPVSEHMLALTLMVIKRLHIYRDQQHAHLWKSQGSVSSLYSSNVLVIGLGDLGRSYANLCSGFGAHVIGVRRSEGKKPDFVERVIAAGEVDSFLPWADIVALCLPENDGTLNFIDERRLSLMKPGAVLINGGRGTAVDLDALVSALSSGRILGAGLDVTSPEPLPPGHPLWDEPSAVITPHIAGGFNLPETIDRIVDLAAENLRRYFSGKVLINLMDRATGNRLPVD